MVARETPEMGVGKPHSVGRTQAGLNTRPGAAGGKPPGTHRGHRSSRRDRPPGCHVGAGMGQVKVAGRWRPLLQGWTTEVLWAGQLLPCAQVTSPLGLLCPRA